MQFNQQRKMITEPFSEKELENHEKDCQQAEKYKEFAEKDKSNTKNVVATSMPLTFISKKEQNEIADEEECVMGINCVIESIADTNNVLTEEGKASKLTNSSQLLVKRTNNWYEEPSLLYNKGKEFSTRNMLDCSYKSPRGDVGHEVFKWRLACRNHCSPLPLCSNSRNINKANNTNKDEKQCSTTITISSEYASNCKCNDEIHSNIKNNQEIDYNVCCLSELVPFIQQDSDVGLHTRNRKERRKEYNNAESKNQELCDTAHYTRGQHSSHSSEIESREQKDIHTNNYEIQWEEISNIHDSNELIKAREQEKIACEENILSRDNCTFAEERQEEKCEEIQRFQSYDKKQEQEQEQVEKEEEEEEEECTLFASHKDKYTKAETSTLISTQRSSFYSSFTSVTAKNGGGDCVGRNTTQCTMSHSAMYAQHTHQEEKCPSLSPLSSKITTAHSSQSSSSRLSRCKERLRSLSKPAFSLAPIEAAQERNMSMIFECSMSGNVECTSDEQESICNAAMCHPISQINDFLYIGTWKDAANRELLDSLDIHYILNVAQELEDGCQSSVSVASFCERSSNNHNTNLNNNEKRNDSNNVCMCNYTSSQSDLSMHASIPISDSQNKNLNHNMNCVNGCNERIENNFSVLHIKQNDIYPVKSLWLPMSDCHHTDISNYFDDAFEFIEEARCHHGKVLVHCRRGISRSAAMVIAYLMATTGKSYKEVWQFVQERRRCISLNLAFQELLSEYVSDKRWRHPSPVYLREEKDINFHSGCNGNTNDYNAFRVNTNIKQTQSKKLKADVNGTPEQMHLHHTSAVEINNALLPSLETRLDNTAIDNEKEKEESTFPCTSALPPRREVWEQMKREKQYKELEEEEEEENHQQLQPLSLSSCVEETEPLDLSVSSRWINVKRRLELKENSFVSSNALDKDDQKNSTHLSIATFETNLIDEETKNNNRHEQVTENKSTMQMHNNRNNFEERIDNDTDDNDDTCSDSSIFTLIKLQSELRCAPDTELLYEEELQEQQLLHEPMSPKRYTHHVTNSSFECPEQCSKLNTCFTKSVGKKECSVDWEESAEQTKQLHEKEEEELSSLQEKCNEPKYLAEHRISNQEQEWQREEYLEEEETQNEQQLDDTCANKCVSAFLNVEQEDKLEEQEEKNGRDVHENNNYMDNHHPLHLSENVKTTLLQPTK